MIEIFIINLRPGTRNKFNEVYKTQSIPLMERWKIDLVDYGPSLHDENTYYVIRSFKSLEDRQSSLEAFYGSEDWQHGPRTTILGFIENSATAVISQDVFKTWAGMIQQ